MGTLRPQTVLLAFVLLVNLGLVLWLIRKETTASTVRYKLQQLETELRQHKLEAQAAQLSCANLEATMWKSLSASHDQWLTRLEHQSERMDAMIGTAGAAAPVTGEKQERREAGPSPTIEPPPHGVHVVFSIECSLAQHWQMEALFYSFHQIDHPGFITCLYSCNSPGYLNLTRLSMRFPRAIVHWTPLYNPYQFTETTSYTDNYPPTNRPMALSHWLEHGDVHGDTIVILDPDMLMIRKFVRQAVEGKPYGQRYIFGGLPWHKDAIAQHFCKKCLDLSYRDIHEKYTPGAPYVMHITDLKRILPMWQDIMRGIRALKINRVWNVTSTTAWISDMIGFSIACIHHNLEWDLREDMMLSRVTDPEDWGRVSWKTKEDDLPFVLHLCQPYEVGKGTLAGGDLPMRRFYKHDSFYERNRWNPLRCGMQVEIATGDLAKVYPNGAKSMLFAQTNQDTTHRDPEVAGFRNAWMLKHLVPALNGAFHNWQTFHLCPEKMMLWDDDLGR